MAHNVIEEVLENNSWRDSDFAQMKIRCSQSTEDQLLRRMCIPMIYAHWEGFIVSAIKEILKHLNTLQLTPTEVPTRLVVHCLGDAYKSLSGKQKLVQRIAFTDKFNKLMMSTMKFKTKVDTKSNLNSDVLMELCEIFSFKFDRFSSILPDINRLIFLRNAIAHGENSAIPTIESINLYIESVKNGTEILLNEMDIFLKNETYKVTEAA